MAERPQPRGFEVNQPGSTRETFTGLAQGATTDLAGSVVDLGAAATGIASQVDSRLLSMSPKAALLSYLNPFAEQAQKVAGSEALGQRVFGDAPTEELQKIRDDARLVGGIAGLGEMLTAKGAKTVAGGIEDFMQFLPNVRAQAVTPEGSMLPLPDDALPDTSITKMSADTPGAALRSVQTFAKGIKGGEALIETMPNRLLFPDLKFSEVTLRESNIEPGAVDIELLRAGEKGKGLGSKTLKRITDRADETGTTLTLYPAPYGEGGLEEAELIEFYQRNGFEFKFPDPDNPDPILDMVRKPRPTAPKSTGLLGGDKPQRFYHGTGETFKDFDPDAEVTFVSDMPSTAEYYAGDISDGAPNIIPVYLKDANFFDVDNPEHIKQLRESDWYKSRKDELDDGFTYPGEGDFVDAVEAGNYDVIEESGLVNWIKSQDFDGFTTYEQDGKNYGVFNVDNIVPGVEKKAEGGVITLADVARNMSRGPRGVASLAPVARNMNRPMVS